MYLIGLPILKEIDIRKGCFGWLKVTFVKWWEEEEKGEENRENFQEHISSEPLHRFLSNLVHRVVYMEGITYVNLIEIGAVVIEIRGDENGELAVPVNNTLVSHMAFLAADTRPCEGLKTVS